MPGAQLARQPYYRWLASPVTEPIWPRRYRANALFDAHRDDPEFGYRFLADEARRGRPVDGERTGVADLLGQGWWSFFGKEGRGKAKHPGPPVHDDLVNRDFTADAPNQLWLTDITEHHTDEGKLYLCAIKDVYSNRIVGYSIDSTDEVPARRRTRSTTAVARRGADVAGCIGALRPRVAISVTGSSSVR